MRGVRFYPAAAKKTFRRAARKSHRNSIRTTVWRETGAPPDSNSNDRLEKDNAPVISSPLSRRMALEERLEQMGLFDVPTEPLYTVAKTRLAYQNIAFALLFLIVQVLFMYFEPIPEISKIHENIRKFITDTSPACIDDELECIDFEDVHDWAMMTQWTRQSVIAPVWGDYGGETGVILQYLSLGEELIIWTRRGDRSDKCPDWTQHFVVHCASRKDEIAYHDWTYGNITMVYDEEVNAALPDDTLYKRSNRGGFFFMDISVDGNSYEEAKQLWESLYENGFYSASTDEVLLMWIVVSPKERIITLIQIHFITNANFGGIEPAFSIWSFKNMDTTDRIMRRFWDVIFSLLILFRLAVEIGALLGYKTVKFFPTKRKDKCSHLVSAINYLKDMAFLDLTNWVIIILSIWSIFLRIDTESDIKTAMLQLNNPGSNAKGYAKLINAQSAHTKFTMVAALTLLLSCLRLFKYCATHPRLGEISNALWSASSAISHFMLVFVVLMAIYGFAGHFLFAYAYPDDFGTIGAACVATVKMITGEIAYDDLLSAYGSTSVDLHQAVEIPVMLFYFGFFFIVIMLMLNIFLGIIISAYDSIHQEVEVLDDHDHNFFVDVMHGVEELKCKCWRFCEDMLLHFFPKRNALHHDDSKISMPKQQKTSIELTASAAQSTLMPSNSMLETHISPQAKKSASWQNQDEIVVGNPLLVPPGKGPHSEESAGLPSPALLGKEPHSEEPAGLPFPAPLGERLHSKEPAGLSFPAMSINDLTVRVSAVENRLIAKLTAVEEKMSSMENLLRKVYDLQLKSALKPLGTANG